MEIDNDSPLGIKLQQLSQAGELNKESFKQILDDKLIDFIENIDWKNVPVDKYV